MQTCEYPCRHVNIHAHYVRTPPTNHTNPHTHTNPTLQTPSRKREMERIERMMAERDEEERKAQEELAKKAGSRIELEKKIAKMLKHMDHLERAKREEEVPLLQAAMLEKAKVCF